MKTSRLSLVGNGHGAKIGNKMQPAIAAILTKDSVAAAARAVGIHENTLARWMKDPHFAKRLAEARSEVFSQAIGLLQNSATEAAETVVTVMRNKKGPVMSRLHAAQMVLQHAKKDARRKAEQGFSEETRKVRKL